MKYAPIMVSVYDRPQHFKACIESLAQNKDAEKTQLFVSSDGPKDDVTAQKVAEVREYIKNIKGFKKVYTFCEEENTRGRIRTDVYRRIKSDFRSYIETEDDNIFSPYALNYFNQGLKLFESNQEIHAICGYMFPGFPASKLEHIYLKCFAPWGVAHWRDKDIYPNVNEKEFAREAFNNGEIFSKINGSLPHIAPLLQQISQGSLEAGDVIRCCHVIKNNQLCVFPSVSLVRNIGNDGSGQHCSINPIYGEQIIADQKIKIELRKPLKAANEDMNWITSYYGGQLAVMRGYLIFIECTSKFVLIKYFFRLLNRLVEFLKIPVRIYKISFNNARLTKKHWS